MGSRDAEATKKRILDAAIAEFAEHGLAGARVDRIADAAGANKRMIYAYFGNKEGLFDTIIDSVIGDLVDAVPLTADDLPGYAGALFDYLVERPTLLRLAGWRQLEKPEPTAGELATYGPKVAAIADAQARGVVRRNLSPPDVMTLVYALAMAWFSNMGATGASATKDIAEQRRVVVESVARVTGAASRGAASRTIEVRR